MRLCPEVSFGDLKASLDACPPGGPPLDPTLDWTPPGLDSPNPFFNEVSPPSFSRDVLNPRFPRPRSPALPHLKDPDLTPTVPILTDSSAAAAVLSSPPSLCFLPLFPLEFSNHSHSAVPPPKKAPSCTLFTPPPVFLAEAQIFFQWYVIFLLPCRFQRPPSEAALLKLNTLQDSGPLHESTDWTSSNDPAITSRLPLSPDLPPLFKSYIPSFVFFLRASLP